MKIEVCEQMIAAWLKYVNDCQIVQTNWKPSPLKQPDPQELNGISGFIEEIKRFADENGLDILKKSSVLQMILQCEIDIVGIRIEAGAVKNLYLIDSAFHENGLNYADAEARVLKKIVRALFVAGIVFKNIPAEIFFVSPRCGRELGQKLSGRLKELDGIIRKFYPDSKVRLLFNEAFALEIYAPLIARADKISDDNDLFLRSLRLVEVAREFLPAKTTDASAPLCLPPLPGRQPDNLPNSPARGSASEIFLEHNGKNMVYRDLTKKTPRGQNKDLVFSVLHHLIYDCRADGNMIRNLCDPLFCQRTFSLAGYPFLLPATRLPSSRFGETRFYKNDPVEINGTVYLVCSQWIPERIRQLTSWYQKQKNFKN